MPAALVEEPVQFPRTECQISFRSPARFFDLLDVSLGIAQLGERRIQLRFEVRQQANGRLVAEGTYEIACVDPATFKGRPIPPALLSLLRTEFDTVAERSELRRETAGRVDDTHSVASVPADSDRDYPPFPLPRC